MPGVTQDGARSTTTEAEPSAGIWVRLGWVLLAAQLILSLLDAALSLTWIGRRLLTERTRPWVDVRFEYSLPSLVGMAGFLFAGIALVAMGRRTRGVGPLLGGAFFVYLAVDDALLVHEHLGRLVYPLTAGTDVYPWLFALGPVFAGIGLLLWLDLRRRLPDVRARRRATAGFALLGTALLLEVAEGSLQRSGLTWNGIERVRLGQCLEELCESVGPTLLGLAALPRRRPSVEP